MTAISGASGEKRALRVDALEALDGTPIIDPRPVLASASEIR